MMKKWRQFLKEETLGQNIDRFNQEMLRSGPNDSGPYEEDDTEFKDRSKNQISAPPGAPGGLEEDIDPETFEKHSDLDPQFWNENMELREEVAQRLLQIANDFIEDLEVDFQRYDIRLTGSLANYNWSQYSDLDVHIVVNFAKIDSDEKVVKAFFDAARLRWNDKHDIMIYDHEVEIYVEDLNEEHISSGVYSILRHEWVVEPDAQEVDIDHVTARKKSDNIMTQINLIQKMVKRKPLAALGSIERLQGKIKTMRKQGLQGAAREYSAENIAFKILRREEALKLLSDMRDQAYDAAFSLRQK